MRAHDATTGVSCSALTSLARSAAARPCQRCHSSERVQSHVSPSNLSMIHGLEWEFVDAGDELWFGFACTLRPMQKGALWRHRRSWPSRAEEAGVKLNPRRQVKIGCKNKSFDIKKECRGICETGWSLLAEHIYILCVENSFVSTFEVFTTIVALLLHISRVEYYHNVRVFQRFS